MLLVLISGQLWMPILHWVHTLNSQKTFRSNSKQMICPSLKLNNHKGIQKHCIYHIYVIVIEHLRVNYVVIKHEGQGHSDRGVAEVTMATPRVFY